MKCALFLFSLAIVYGNRCQAIYFTNTTHEKINNNHLVWTEEGIWGTMLEEWTLGGAYYRTSKVMQIPISENAYIIKDQVDSEIPKESKINVGKIVSSNNSNRPTPNMKPPTRQVTETDLYLLSAIEKLVYKVDFMEKRLRKLEEMLYYVMAGNRMDIEPCLENFTRVAQNCYIFASTAGREYDWKAASKHCKKLGAVLAEMETIEENQDIVAYIQNNVYLKGKDFWVGGLNPGLLWIWSNSARPILPPGSQNNEDKQNAIIQGQGRCLKLAYNPALRSYTYKGSDCSMRHNYICELPENTSSNEIQRIGRKKNVFND